MASLGQLKQLQLQIFIENETTRLPSLTRRTTTLLMLLILTFHHTLNQFLQRSQLGLINQLKLIDKVNEMLKGGVQVGLFAQ